MKLIQRSFHIWDASSSHAKLLLRSPRNQTHGVLQNIDITFWGVSYVELPFILRGLELVEPTHEEVALLSERLQKDVQADDVFVLVSQGQRNFVVAVNYTVQENDLDIFASSLEKP